MVAYQVSQAQLDVDTENSETNFYTAYPPEVNTRRVVGIAATSRYDRSLESRIQYGTLYDVYDGRMWSALKDSTGAPFVNRPRSLMLTLNVDWFQPFNNSPHSCGAIYLTINNLPRSVRNKIKNIILVGMIPGPEEPSKDKMNHYLRPLVDELEALYEGISIPTAQMETGTVVRAALLMIACDIPAARKVAGFTSIHSFFACHKCNHQFPSLPSPIVVTIPGLMMIRGLGGQTKATGKLQTDGSPFGVSQSDGNGA